MRKRPGMFIGNPRSRHGVVALVNELFANVADLFMVGKATRFSVRCDRDRWVTVIDDGPGLPFDQWDENFGMTMLEKHVSVGHDKPTADDHVPHVHMSSLGIGLITIGAYSEELEIESCRGGVRYRQRFGRGVVLSEATKEPISAPDGSQFRFLPDPEIFGDFSKLDFLVLRARMFTAAHLFPGLVIEVQDERFCAPGGMGAYVETLVAAETHGDGNALRFSGSTELCRIDFACGGRRAKGNPTWIQSWANGIQTTEGGTHVTGMKRALARAGVEPGIAALNVILDSPSFGSPTKSKLVVRGLDSDVEKALNQFFKELSG